LTHYLAFLATRTVKAKVKLTASQARKEKLMAVSITGAIPKTTELQHKKKVIRLEPKTNSIDLRGVDNINNVAADQHISLFAFGLILFVALGGLVLVSVPIELHKLRNRL
jgi:hypothetical protein